MRTPEKHGRARGVELEVLHDVVVTGDSRGGAEAGPVCVYPVPCVLDDGSVVCVYRSGSAKHSRDAVLMCRRSTDRGKTWTRPVPAFDRRDAPEPLSLHAGAVGRAGDGSILLTYYSAGGDAAHVRACRFRVEWSYLDFHVGRMGR